MNDIDWFYLDIEDLAYRGYEIGLQYKDRIGLNLREPWWSCLLVII